MHDAPVIIQCAVWFAWNPECMAGILPGCPVHRTCFQTWVMWLNAAHCYLSCMVHLQPTPTSSTVKRYTCTADVKHLVNYPITLHRDCYPSHTWICSWYLLLVYTRYYSTLLLFYVPEILPCSLVSTTTDLRISQYSTHIFYFEVFSTWCRYFLFERSEFLIATCKKKKTDRLCVRIFG